MITHPLHRDDPLRWAAARAVGTSSQLLVSRLAQASSSQAVTECVRAALTLLGNNTNSVSNCEAAAAALGAAAAPAGQEDIQQLCLQQLRQLQQHAAVLGWPALRDIFFQDQFETWASVVLSGESLSLAHATNTARHTVPLAHCLHTLAWLATWNAAKL